MERFVSSLVNLVFPLRCIVCGAHCGQSLCEGCLAALPRIEPPICVRCGSPVMAAAEGCTECEDRNAPYSVARSIFIFDGHVRDVVHALKYANGRRLAPVLAAEAADHLRRLESSFFDTNVITFVPLHPSRHAERGYNQSQLVARALSRRVDVRARGLLRQVRLTGDQSRLSAEERRENVGGAFEARPSTRLHVGGRRILLVDDVFTTGATVGECSAALLRAGAREVRVLTLARAGDVPTARVLESRRASI